jgi:HNH endonuclease
MREPRDENAAAKGKADYLRADLSPAAGPLETPCLVWRGSSRGGYGDIWYKRRNYRVHRLAYIIANGPIPPGLQVIHSCNNGLCCNPLHLRVGTKAEH